MSRIIQVITLYPPDGGGASIVCHQSSQALKQRGWDVYVFTGRIDPSNSPFVIKDYHIGEIKVRSINLNGIIKPTYEGAIDGSCKENFDNPVIGDLFESYVQEVKPDLIHFHSIQWIGLNVIEKSIELEIPSIITMHDWWWVCPRQFMVTEKWTVCETSKNCKYNKKGLFRGRSERIQKILQEIDLVLTPSITLRKSLYSNGLDFVKIEVLENGVNRPKQFSTSKRSKSGILRFGYFGGCNTLKGIDTLLDAIRILRGRDFLLRLYGFGRENTSGTYNDIRSKSKRVLKKPGLLISQLHNMRRHVVIALRGEFDSRIEFLPFFSYADLDKVLSNIDVMVVPSLMRESYSLVTREAMVRKIPVITSDSGAPEEVVIDNYNGFVFPTGDYHALGKRVLKIIDHPELVDKFRSNISINNILTVRDYENKLFDFYKKVIKTK